MKTLLKIAASLVLVCSATLLAHTTISSTSPADGSVISAPTEIRLEFSAAVRLTAVKMQASDGDDVALGGIPGDVTESFSITIADALQPGSYVVTWRSISGDSHVVSGEFGFTVAP